MWIHIVIFAGTAFVWAGLRLKKIQFSALQDAKSRKLFFGLVLGGNALGMLLTWQSGGVQTLEKGSYLMKEESGAYEEKLQVELPGEEAADVQVQVPAREISQPSQTEEKAETEETFQQKLTREIVKVNEEIGDPDRYYLPERIEEKTLVWKRPADTGGALLAALCLAAAVTLMVGREKERGKEQEKRREQMLQDYPNLVMKLTLLVQAGMTVRMAFRKIAHDYQGMQACRQARYAYEEIAAACNEMDSGISEMEAYERFGDRCGEAKYKTLATLLVQNLQKGSQRLLEMLERESMEAFEDRKRKARVLGEAAATKLLVPMILMLLIVLAIVMIPAVLSFYG